MLEVKKNVLPEHKLKELLYYWQKALRLVDWDIQLHKVHLGEMENEGCCAETSRHINTKSSIIKIVHAEEYEAGRRAIDRHQEFDDELTLVHELLHLMFMVDTILFLPSGDPDQSEFIRRHFEQSIDLTAQALVYLKRQNEPRFKATHAVMETRGTNT